MEFRQAVGLEKGPERIGDRAIDLRLRNKSNMQAQVGDEAGRRLLGEICLIAEGQRPAAHGQVGKDIVEVQIHRETIAVGHSALTMKMSKPKPRADAGTAEARGRISGSERRAGFPPPRTLRRLRERLQPGIGV
jgi:hypothetical protein